MLYSLFSSFYLIFLGNHITSQVEEKEESIWASALSCLLYFVCDRGKIRRSRLKALDIRVSFYVLALIGVCEWSCKSTKVLSSKSLMFRLTMAP